MPLSRRRADLPIDETMQSEEGNYTRTDLVVAIILAAIAVVWILAYIVFFVKSGAA
jgi:hypothetical protein